MALGKVNKKVELRKDITWKQLVEDARAKIKEHKRQIVNLNKSIVFFIKQDTTGATFPVSGEEIVDVVLNYRPEAKQKPPRQRNKSTKKATPDESTERESST
jgi:hypothetical protein